MINYVITILLSFTSGMLIFAVQNLCKANQKLREEKKKKAESEDSAIRDGLVCLLRIQLIEYHEKYMPMESLPTYVFESWDKMYHAYKALGGNGMIEHMNEDMNDLKLRNK